VQRVLHGIEEARVIAAVIASVIGGLVAVGLSLPLRSPDDIFFNAGSVAIGSLLAGVAAGAVWSAVNGHARRFQMAMGAGFVVIAVAILAAEQLFTGMFAFALPLAAVVLGSIAFLTPLLARRALPMGAMAAVVPLLAAGWMLADRGDAEVRTLALPPTAGATTATPTAAASVPGTAPSGPGPTSTAATAGTPGASASGFRTPADVRGVVFAVGQGSEAQFTVREKLAQLSLPNDATMHTTALTGDVRLDGPSTVLIDITKLTSDQSRRDNFIRQQWSRQPTATVTIDNIGALPAQYTPGEVVKRQVTGRLNILGNEAPIAFDVEGRLEGDTVSLLGKTTFKWADFKISPPNTPTVQVEDQVNVTVLLVAKAKR
jgi:hypothetical protein